MNVCWSGRARSAAAAGCAVLLVGALGAAGLVACNGQPTRNAQQQVAPQQTAPPLTSIDTADPTPTASMSASASESASPVPKPKVTKPKLPISRSRVETKKGPKPKPSAVPLLPPAIALQATAPPANVYGPDFPDPEVIYDAVTDEYYAFATNTVGVNVQRLVSKDGLHWKRLADALPALPADAVAGGTWAPSVRFNATTATWVMTFAYLSGRTNREQLGVATAPAPDATFVPRPGVLRALDDGHVIDPDTILVGGVPYLVSVEARTSGNRFVAQQETADGLAVVGHPFVLASAPYVLEGPTVLVMGDTVVCIFANGESGVWNEPGYSTYYVEDSVERVFGQQRHLDLRQARPLMITWPGSAVATGEPATALDPLTGNVGSTNGTLTFYTNDLHKENLFGNWYDARYLMAYPVRIGDGGQRPGGPIALWSPPPTASPKPSPKPSAHPRPTPQPLPTFIPTTPVPSPTPRATPKPSPTATVQPTPKPTPTARVRTPGPQPSGGASRNRVSPAPSAARS